jgi:hypothetical protein
MGEGTWFLADQSVVLSGRKSGHANERTNEGTHLQQYTIFSKGTFLGIVLYSACFAVCHVEAFSVVILYEPL